MLDSVILEVLYCLLAGKLAFFLFMYKVEQFIENAKELFVLLVDDEHSCVISLIPFQTRFHVLSSLKSPGLLSVCVLYFTICENTPECDIL